MSDLPIFPTVPPSAEELANATEGAALMRRAADVIEERGVKATKLLCPTWTYQAVRHVARNCDIECTEHDPYDTDDAGCPSFSRYDDSPWIALMSAHVAEPLVAWLRATAEDAEMVGPDFRAVRFARAVLRETQ